MTSWVSLTAAAALGLAALFALALYSAGLAGVVARFELVRLARGGRQPLARGLVALGALGGLVLAYLNAAGADQAWAIVRGRMELPRDRLAGVGETFLLAFLAVQMLAVYLAAPVVLAGGVAKEKERGTLDDLLATELTAWDVVAGKFLAGWLYVLGVAAAGLPALAAASVFGGIDPQTLLGGALLVVYGSAGLGAAATRAAARAQGLREALAPLTFVLAALTVLGLVGGLIPGVVFVSPAASLAWLLAARGAGTPAWVVAPALGLFAVAYAVYVRTALRSAARALRVEAAPPPPRVPERQEFPTAVPVYGVEARASRAVPTTSAVPDGGAFAWKERRSVGGRDRAILLGLTGLGLAVGALFVSTVAVDSRHREWAGDAFNPLARLSLAGLAVAGPLAAGARAAGAVARERERRTLDSLLSTPADRAELLAAKLGGALRGPLVVALAVAGFLALAMILGGVYPPGALAGLFAGVGGTLAAGAAGLYFSAGARTSLRASLIVYGCLFAAWVGPVVLSPLAPPGVARAAVAALSPPVGAFRAAGRWQFYRATPPGCDWDALTACAVAGLTGLLAALVTWAAARRRFERLGR